MKKILLFYFFFLSLFTYPKSVDLITARRVAVNLCKYEKPLFNNIYPEITDYFVVCPKQDTLLYIFNISDNGFVIISAEDKYFPILAYSAEGKYIQSNLPPALQGWFNNVSNQISQVKQLKTAARLNVKLLWDKYLNFNNDKSDKKVVIEPLLLSRWDQGAFYNELCPADEAGAGGHAYAGCTATAMAQIMFYYRYPEYGSGSYSYEHPKYGYLYADFAQSSYKWDYMPLSINKPNKYIASLLYHCGVSVDMYYSPEGSGANIENAAYSLMTYFKYSSKANTIYRYNYSDTKWKIQLRRNLDSKHPLLYAGFDENAGSGHAFVCDGYRDSSLFHFNWGWSGLYNGYFNIDKLTPGSNDFSDYQHCVSDIFPAVNYPVFCSSSNLLTNNEGTIEDGSGYLNYKSDNDCSWLISPSEAQYIMFKFNRFYTEKNKDSVVLYDGPDITSPVLAVFSGIDSAKKIISSSTDKMLVRFITDKEGEDVGWAASYYIAPIVYCKDVLLFDKESDTITDGSSENNYSDYSNCKWLIQPKNANYIKLDFLEFDTEPGNDFIRIINYDTTPPTVLAMYSGQEIPPSVEAWCSKMLIIFSSNDNNRYKGWKAVYTSTSDINDNKNSNPASQILLYPNPANQFINIQLNSLNNNQLIKYYIYNLQGEMIYSEITVKRENLISVSNYTQGLYLIKIVLENKVISKMFNVLH